MGNEVLLLAIQIWSLKESHVSLRGVGSLDKRCPTNSCFVYSSSFSCKTFNTAPTIGVLTAVLIDSFSSDNPNIFILRLSQGEDKVIVTPLLATNCIKFFFIQLLSKEI